VKWHELQHVIARHLAPEPVPPAHTLDVDLYGGSFVRVIPTPMIADDGSPVTATVRLATEPGPNGEIYDRPGDVPNTAAVWVDYGGALGKVKLADGHDVLGQTLTRWIHDGMILTVHRGTDGGHPTLIVESTEPPPEPVPAVPVLEPGAMFTALPAVQLVPVRWELHPGNRFAYQVTDVVVCVPLTPYGTQYSRLEDLTADVLTALTGTAYQLDPQVTYASDADAEPAYQSMTVNVRYQSIDIC
jgi:hypothetical protein